MSYSSISELNQLLGSLQQTSEAIQGDLFLIYASRNGRRTSKWPKHQTEGDVESVQRNLQSALPSMLNDLKNSPESTPLTFKVYRNLDALYDVMSSVVESAGAFGSKDEFLSLNKDLGSLEDSRRAFADRLDKNASAKEIEIGQLRAALQTARAEIPPKKTVVDDTQPATPKKPAKRKKPATVPKPQDSQATPPPATQAPKQ